MGHIHASHFIIIRHLNTFVTSVKFDLNVAAVRGSSCASSGCLDGQYCPETSRKLKAVIENIRKIKFYVCMASVRDAPPPSPLCSNFISNDCQH